MLRITTVLVVAGLLVSPGARAAVLDVARVSASSVEDGNDAAGPENAVDGDEATRWASGRSDPQWLVVDFDEPREFNSVNILWEPAFADLYKIQVSDDGTTWATVHDEDMGDGHLDEIVFRGQKARYLRILCTHRGSPWGYSIYEVAVEQRDGAVPPRKRRAENVSFSADAASVTRVIDRRLFGLNIVPRYMETIFNYSEPELINLLRLIKPGIIRGWPVCDGQYFAGADKDICWIPEIFPPGKTSQMTLTNGAVLFEGRGDSLLSIKQRIPTSAMTRGREYTLSAYMRSDGIAPRVGGWEVKGVRMNVVYTDCSAADIAVLDNGDGTCEARRLSRTFTFDPDPLKTIRNIQVYIQFTPGVGRLYVDKVQLEEGATVHAFGSVKNLVVDGDLSRVVLFPKPYNGLCSRNELDEFIGLCRKVGAEPLIVLNLGTVHYTNAAVDRANCRRQREVVRYVNKVRNYGVKYFQFGNEPLTWRHIIWNDRGPNDQDWYCPLDEDTVCFAERFNRYYAALQEESPGFIAMGPTWFQDHLAALLDKLLTPANRRTFALTHHYYPLMGRPGPPRIQDVLSDKLCLEDTERLLKPISALAGGREIYVTEYDCDGPFKNTMADVLWTVHFLLTGALNGLTGACRFEFGRTFDYSVVLDDYTIRNPYYLHYLFARHFGTKLLAVTCDRGALPVNVYASASADDRKLYFMIPNRSLTTEYRVRINFTHSPIDADRARVDVLRVPSVGDRDGGTLNGHRIDPFDLRNSVRLIETSAESIPVENGAFTCSVKPYSLAVVSVSGRSGQGAATVQQEKPRTQE